MLLAHSLTTISACAAFCISSGGCPPTSTNPKATQCRPGTRISWFHLRQVVLRNAIHTCTLSSQSHMIRGSVPMAQSAKQSVNSKESLFAGAMPKGIGAPEFLKAYHEYDGRGVVIAILDTGVDPGAAGLQVTSDGKPKILDILDGTGSGDIDTSTVVQADSENVISGIFDTPLKVNREWRNPSGEWHVGYKRAYDLFAKGLQKRITKERRKRLDGHQRSAMTQATKDLAAATTRQASAKTVTEEEKKSFKDLEERMKLLGEFDKFEDPGPLIHAVVWNDGEKWLTAVDTSDLHEPGSGQGALADYQPLADFSLERQYATFSAEDACNYGVHVYEDGNLLSVVVECGSHGTHVAGIAAAYHADEPHLNGIAPGAQIISCKIGDSRIDGMETNVGLTRALIDVLRHKADLINLSYGESTATPNSGRFIELANEVVNKHGVIFISSAGNAGPALSSVGAPGGTTSSIVAVGAYVSPELAAAGHSVREALDKGQQYTWSSRGPTPDGHGGVVVSAPGGAIAPVPQWTQQSRQLMNGTSMASPCACGGFALLLSGLKASGQGISPNRVRRAVENTSQPINDAASSEWPLTYGRGLLQVHRAFDYLSKSGEVDQPDVRYEVKVKRADSSVSQRGIYLREPLETAQPSSHIADISPQLREGADTRQECLRVEDNILLSSTAGWVSCPGVLLLPYNGRNFEIKVDPTGLEPGVHYAEVLGHDSSAEWRGPLFRVPITVIKAAKAETATAANGQKGSTAASGFTACLGTLDFRPGQEVRRFIETPEGATWAEMRIHAGLYDTQKVYMVRASQLLPHTRYSDTEARHTLTLPPGTEKSLSFAVTGGATLEVTFAQFWSSLGSSSLEAELAFHGVQAAPAAVHLDGASGVAKLYVRASIAGRREKVAPTAKLSKVCIPLRPADAVLAPMVGARDALPENRTIHKLELTYKLKVEEAGAHKPTMPLLNRFVYDAALEAGNVHVYDGNRRLLGVGDVYPEEAQLQKGDHTIRVRLRHDDPKILEGLRDLPLVVERKLKDPLTVPVYATHSDAVTGSNAVKDFVVCPGEQRALFVGPLPDDKLPKDATPGRSLVGKLQLGKLSEMAGGKDAPHSIPLSYSVPPKKETKEAPTVADAEGDSKPSAEEQLREKLRDARVKFLEAVKEPVTEAEAALHSRTADEVMAEFPDHLPVLLWKLKRAESAWSAKAKANEAGQGDIDAVLQAADGVLAAVDQEALARWLALQNPEEGPGAEKTKKQMEEQKAAVIAALHTKARVLIEDELSKSGDAEAGPGSPTSASSVAFQDLRKWVDTTEAQYAVLHAKREMLSGRFASALRLLQKVASPEDKLPEPEALELQIKLLGNLGWTHWQQAEQSRKMDAFPPAYRPF